MKVTKRGRYSPTLPKPPGKATTTRRIVFSRSQDEIRLVSDYLFDDPGFEPQEVGEQCFDRTARKLSGTVASPSSVPFHLRPNKYVERRVFIELLDYVHGAFGMSNALYISMGGRLLEDHRLVHDAFRTRRLISIEADADAVINQNMASSSA